MIDYLRDPAEITRRSFETVRTECDLSGLTPAQAELAVRLVHACGMTDILVDLAWGGAAAEAGAAALKSGAPVLCDARMVAEGITRVFLPSDNEILCSLQDEGVAERARGDGTTRSAAAVDLWRPHLEGAVVAIGNAPTALFRLIEILQDGAPKPAAILAFPVGFIGAAESKEALIEARLGVPYVTLRGRRGGSALAAAAVNALALRNP
jgi:precorrin-8X/cobalt-precorrin-8 methylmutase